MSGPKSLEPKKSGWSPRSARGVGPPFKQESLKYSCCAAAAPTNTKTLVLQLRRSQGLRGAGEVAPPGEKQHG